MRPGAINHQAAGLQGLGFRVLGFRGLGFRVLHPQKLKAISRHGDLGALVRWFTIFSVGMGRSLQVRAHPTNGQILIHVVYESGSRALGIRLWGLGLA